MTETQQPTQTNNKTEKSQNKKPFVKNDKGNNNNNNNKSGNKNDGKPAYNKKDNNNNKRKAPAALPATDAKNDDTVEKVDVKKQKQNDAKTEAETNTTTTETSMSDNIVPTSAAAAATTDTANTLVQLAAPDATPATSPDEAKPDSAPKEKRQREKRKSTKQDNNNNNQQQGDNTKKTKADKKATKDPKRAHRAVPQANVAIPKDQALHFGFNGEYILSLIAHLTNTIVTNYGFTTSTTAQMYATDINIRPKFIHNTAEDEKFTPEDDSGSCAVDDPSLVDDEQEHQQLQDSEGVVKQEIKQEEQQKVEAVAAATENTMTDAVDVKQEEEQPQQQQQPSSKKSNKKKIQTAFIDDALYEQYSRAVQAAEFLVRKVLYFTLPDQSVENIQQYVQEQNQKQQQEGGDVSNVEYTMFEYKSSTEPLNNQMLLEISKYGPFFALRFNTCIQCKPTKDDSTTPSLQVIAPTDAVDTVKNIIDRFYAIWSTKRDEVFAKKAKEVEEKAAEAAAATTTEEKTTAATSNDKKQDKPIRFSLSPDQVAKELFYHEFTPMEYRESYQMFRIIWDQINYNRQLFQLDRNVRVLPHKMLRDSYLIQIYANTNEELKNLLKRSSIEKQFHTLYAKYVKNPHSFISEKIRKYTTWEVKTLLPEPLKQIMLVSLDRKDLRIQKHNEKLKEQYMSKEEKEKLQQEAEKKKKQQYREQKQAQWQAKKDATAAAQQQENQNKTQYVQQVDNVEPQQEKQQEQKIDNTTPVPATATTKNPTSATQRTVSKPATNDMVDLDLIAPPKTNTADNADDDLSALMKKAAKKEGDYKFASDRSKFDRNTNKAKF